MQYTKLEPVLVEVIVENKFPRDSEETIKKALEKLDVEGKGYLTSNELRRYLCGKGEAFAEEDLEEMLLTAADAEGRVFIEDYALMLGE